ncbi:hypothetical protein PsYK624_140570 [Phanerochaete sordida]|uniref:F-box domain-containing protein n=1 Tax=Phanerochaete sordida TaxID=48140 RepID=A0A9P3GM20_9APHY|nr:hypothetical protein PsYK624_140570 [Phanerochaete sordida]
MCLNEQARVNMLVKRVDANNGGHACTFPDTSQCSVVRDRRTRITGEPQQCPEQATDINPDSGGICPATGTPLIMELATYEAKYTDLDCPIRGLPGDVWDLIIDSLRDCTTLKSCAMTCKGFLRRSRLHLFRRVYLKNFHNAKLLVRTLNRDPEARFFVRELLLDFPAATTPTGPVAKSLFATLPCLRALSIRGYPALHASFPAALAPVSQLVTALRLFHVEFADFKEFGDVLLALPRLEELGIHGIDFKSIDLDKGHSGAELQAVRLTKLDYADGFRPDDTRQLAQWLAKTGTPKSLQRLFVMPMTQDPSTAQEFIRVVAQESCTLLLHLGFLYEPFHLPAAHTLQSLKLTVSVYRIVACAELLHSLPAPVLLHELCLHFVLVSGEPGSARFEWGSFTAVATLDVVLRRFKKLERFDVRPVLDVDGVARMSPFEERREYVSLNWLPGVAKHVWADLGGPAFYVEPPRLSWLHVPQCFFI